MIKRLTDKTEEGKAKEMEAIKDLPQYWQVNGCIILISLISFLTNSSMNNSRHTADIINDEVFKQLMNIFDLVSENPLLTAISLNLNKTLKNLLDPTYLSNINFFVEKFKTQMTAL